jgi:hypothetical protein
MELCSLAHIRGDDAITTLFLQEFGDLLPLDAVLAHAPCSSMRLTMAMDMPSGEFHMAQPNL